MDTTQQHDQQHETKQAPDQRAVDTGVPGKASRSAALASPDSPKTSGLLEQSNEPNKRYEEEHAKRMQARAKRHAKLDAATKSGAKGGAAPARGGAAAGPAKDAPVGPATGAPAKQQVMRKANGAAPALGDGAQEKIQRATTSSSTGLPGDLRAKFEQSTGKDLSGVRVHTGPESHQATEAVGARAFALGQDIHFNAGEFAPGSPKGDQLIAHETFHTLQAPQSATGTGVSSPSDHAEVEADTNADAMVAGRAAAEPTSAASGVVRRAPKDNSYNRGELKWENGTALTEEEHKAWAEKKAGLITKAAAFLGWATGFKLEDQGDVIEKLMKDAETDYEKKLKGLAADIDHFDDVIDGYDSKNHILHDERTPFEKKRQAEYEARKAAAEKQLEQLESQRSSNKATWAIKAGKVVGTISGYAAKGLSFGQAINSQACAVSPEKFTSASEANTKLQKIVSAVDFGAKLFDRTAIDNFAKDPNFETASAWATQVGNIFASGASFAAGLPAPWDEVIGGVMMMPKIVTGQFIQVVKARYEKIDQETHEPNHGKGRILDEGTSG